MSFPFLRLPSNAVKYVLKHVEQIDAMKLGLCSKIVKELVKHQREVPLEKPHLVMRFGTCYEVTVIREIIISIEDLSTVPENIDYWTIDGEKVAVFKENEITYKMYFENRLSGTQNLVSYLTDILNIPIYGLSIMLTQVQEVDPRIAIDWVMSRQESVQSIQLCANLAAEVKDDIQYALNKCRGTERMEIYVRKNPDLPTESEDDDLFDWLSIVDLIRWDCPKIILGETNIPQIFWNHFLKSWKNGEGNPKLSFLRLTMDTELTDIVINGLGATRVIRDEPIQLVLGPDESYEITNSWDITRNDGRKMSIVESWNSLHFYVWPEN